MTKFTLPKFEDESQWGPQSCSIPDQLKDIPYAPYSKADKIGKVADWGAHDQRDGYNRNRNLQKDQYHSYGHGSVSIFGYQHETEDQTFSVVDNRSSGQKKGPGIKSGRPGGRPPTQRRGGHFQRLGGRGGSRFHQTNINRRRQNWKERPSSIAVGNNWKIVEEVDLHRLQKLRFNVGPVTDISQHGFIKMYDKSYDRVTVRTEKPLKPYNGATPVPVTTTQDPILSELASNNEANVFATDHLLSLLMCCPRSVYPWDIIVKRVGDKLFFDSREGCKVVDEYTVNENAQETPVESTDGSINNIESLSAEAVVVNKAFMLQVANGEETSFENQMPFESESPVPTSYRYRKWDLGGDCTMVARTEVDALTTMPSGENVFTYVRALNEYEPGANGALDWRKRLDTQRGAVVAMEMKNNNYKLSRWAVEAYLSGCEQFKLGYLSRVFPKDNQRHVILGTQTFKPQEFFSQMNFTLDNLWGTLKGLVDLCLSLPEGEYVLMRDGSKSVIRIYTKSEEDHTPTEQTEVSEGDPENPEIEQ